jgi:hypothetical protein
MGNGHYDEFRQLHRTPSCAAGKHGDCPHEFGFGAGLNPFRRRLEAGVGVCSCECHASCPVTPADGRMTVTGPAWRESCSCPGAESERIRLNEAGIDFPDLGAMWAESRRRRQSRQEAIQAVRAQVAGKTPEEIRNLYIAELDSRGLAVPSEEILDANVAAFTGNYASSARILGRLAIDAVRLFRSADGPR